MNGLLLINLGTPAAPTSKAVRRYLRQFLSDPRVLDMNALSRAALLNLVVLPFRPAKSARAYRQIWSSRGSPLLYHSHDLVSQVAARLGPDWQVELGMRYGAPSIAAALDRLQQNVDRVVVFPLYPQYSSASTGSSVEEVLRLSATRWVTPTLSFVEPFYDDPLFIDAWAEVGRPIVEAARPDYVLFSFHGLPERQLRKAIVDGACSEHPCLESPHCCDVVAQANRHCYRAQSFATARALAAQIGLGSTEFEVTFQSRLGRTPWVRPYTDVRLLELAQAGKRRLVVFCPAFVADCLETLEEIGIRAQRDFIAAGGEALTLVPSLNATPRWVETVVELVRRQAARFTPPPQALKGALQPRERAV